MDERLSAYRLLIADVYELAGASRRDSERLARRVGQTAARWHVLSVVSDEPLTVPAIARRLGLTRQGVQRVVNELADARLARLEPNPDHVRSPLVSLSAEGHRVLVDLFDRSDESRYALLDRAGVTAEELAEARRVVRTVTAAFTRP